MNVALARPEATLDSRYEASGGWLYMTGMQALVRLPIQQRLRPGHIDPALGGGVAGVEGRLRPGEGDVHESFLP